MKKGSKIVVNVVYTVVLLAVLGVSAFYIYNKFNTDVNEQNSYSDNKYAYVEDDLLKQIENSVDSLLNTFIIKFQDFYVGEESVNQENVEDSSNDSVDTGGNVENNPSVNVQTPSVETTPSVNVETPSTNITPPVDNTPSVNETPSNNTPSTPSVDSGNTNSSTNNNTNESQNSSQDTSNNVPPAPVVVTEYRQAEAKKMITLINQARVQNGLGELSLNNSLESSAMVRSKEIVTLFSHTRPDQTDCFTSITLDRYYAAGENIAAGQTTIEEVFDAWMNSPGHRANILSSNFTDIGISLYYDSSSTYGYYWVQLFAGI